MYQVTGKTYEIADQLKVIGFVYESTGKRWIGGEEKVEALKAKIAKWTSGTWGVKLNTAARSLVITEVCCETCEI